jgi:TP901 family phage tail tape measure protein
MATPGGIIGEAWVAVRPETTGFETALTGGLQGPLTKAEGMFSGIGKAALVAGGAVAVAGVGIGVVAVKMAADFQTSITQLATGAGESVKNLKLISDGILAMAGQVGQAPIDLAKGIYMIESAGYHGAAALDILRVAAEGAKVGNADLAVVTDAVTTSLNAYHLPASDAAQVTNTLITAVSLGKTHLQDLAGALGAILPIASSLHIPLDQVTAAMATMTVQGTDASKASQSLRFLLAALAGPTAAAAKEMVGLGVGEAQIPGITKSVSAEIQTLGLHTSDVAATLAGPGGLPAALKMITDALVKQFPEYQTNAAQNAAYNAALKTATGGTRGFTAAVELTGPSMKTFTDNIATIDQKVTAAGNSVAGWTLIQGDFNQKIDEAKAAVDAFLIKIGTALLPVLSQAAGYFSTVIIPALMRFSDWFIANGIPAIGKFGQVIGDVAGVVMPPLVAVLGFFANNLWLVEGALAAVVIRMAILKAISLEQTIVGWVTSLGTYVLGLTAAGAAAQAEAATAVAAAGEVTVVTDAMATSGKGAFSLMGLSASGLVLGITAIGVAAVLVATHWTEVTAAFQSPSDAAAKAVKQIDDNLKALDATAASTALKNLSTDTVGLGKAMQASGQTITANFAPALATMQSNIYGAQTAIAANNVKMGATFAGVTSSLYGASAASSKYSTEQKAVFASVNAAMAEVVKQTSATSKGLFDLSSNFGSLTPVVQATIVQLQKAGASNTVLVQTYQALKGEQDQGLPTWTKTGLLMGVATTSADIHRAALVKLAAEQSGDARNATLALITAWDAAGGALVKQTQGITGALPYYQTLIQSYTDQATVIGLSGKAALDWATQQANKIDPAGQNATTTMTALATSMGLTGPGAGAAIQALVNQNPSLLSAFLQQQADAANTALILAGLSGAWNALTKAEQAAMLAAQAARNAASQVPGQTHGILAEGGIVNAPTSGEPWTLHGTEAVVPKGKATPWLWTAMQDAIKGKAPGLPPQGSQIAGLMSGASGGSSVPVGGGGPVSIVQHFNITGSNPADVQAVVRRENATLVTALRAGRR